MTAKLLRESTAATLAKNGKRWKAILAVPGQGSSGFYSEDVLKEYGPKALAPGAKAFVDHDPSRSVRDMIGVYPDGAVYEDGVGLVGELEVFPHWADFVEAVAPHAGLSIYMMGESDNEGNITALIEDRQNGVDLVAYPGLIGSGLAEKLYESAKAASDNGTSNENATTHSKESSMEIKELAEKVDKLTESVNSLVSGITVLQESLTPKETEGEIDLAAVVDAVAEADLPRELRAVVIESVKSGIAVEDAIKSQVALVESIRKSLKAPEPEATPNGRVVEGAKGAFSFKSLTEVAS